MASFSLNKINVNNSSFSYTETILKYIYEHRDSVTPEQFDKAMNRIIKTFKKWIKNYNNLINEVNNQRKVNYKNEMYAGGKNYKSENSFYKKLQKDLNILLDKALVLTKDGYKMMHLFREAMTGEEIVYKILARDSKTRELYEGNLSMEQLLKKITSVSYDKEELEKDEKKDYQDIIKFKLRINQELNFVKEMKKNNSLEKFVTPLYDQLEELYLNDETNFNRGHIYEMYTYLVNEKGYKAEYRIEYPKSKENAELLNAVAKYARGNVPSYKGGDAAIKDINNKIIDAQLKNISNAGAGLVTGLTIKNFMTNVIEAYKNKDKNFKEEIIKLLTKDIKENDGILTHKLDYEMSNKINDALLKFLNQVIT